MVRINYWAVVVAAFAAFVMSSLYYSLHCLATCGVRWTPLVQMPLFHCGSCLWRFCELSV